MSEQPEDVLPKRRPRFRRQRNGGPPFRLQERDRMIVRLVNAHHIMASSEIQALTPGSKQSVLRRLQCLFHSQFLDRPTSQLQLANRRMVYAVGREGAILLAAEEGRQAHRVANQTERNRTLRTQYVDHAIMASRFRTALTLACGDSSPVALESWKQGQEIVDSVIVSHDDRVERLPVCPDGYFVLRLRNEPDGRNRIHAFVEVDRSTMTVKRYVTKLRGYWHYWRSGKQEQRFGIRNFLVLSLTVSEARAKNLCEAARAVDSQGRGLRMFLFAAEQSVLSGVFDPKWKTPADDIGHTVLE